MNTFFRFNTPFGLLMGLVLAIATYTASHIQGKILNCEALSSTISILCIIGLYIQIRSYRDKIYNGRLSFGRAFCTGLWIIFIAATINSGVTIYLYKTDPLLFENYITYMKEMVNALPNNENKQMMLTVIPYITVSMLGVIDFFSKIFVGTIYSLIISSFTRRKLFN